jgi:hypothetical protein
VVPRSEPTIALGGREVARARATGPSVPTAVYSLGRTTVPGHQRSRDYDVRSRVDLIPSFHAKYLMQRSMNAGSDHREHLRIGYFGTLPLRS